MPLEISKADHLYFSRVDSYKRLHLDLRWDKTNRLTIFQKQTMFSSPEVYVCGRKVCIYFCFFLKCTYTQCKSIMAASVKQLSGKHWKAWAKWAEWQLILQRLQMGRWRCPQSKEVASLALVTCADRHRYCITWMLVNMLFPDSAQGWEDCF